MNVKRFNIKSNVHNHLKYVKFYFKDSQAVHHKITN